MEGLLPIFQERPNSRPKSSTLKPSEIRNYLNEQVRLERLANSSINNQADTQIFLEPVPPELFSFFRDEDNDPMAEDCIIDGGNLELMSIGNLKTRGTIEKFPSTPLLLNITTYQAKRRKLQEYKDRQQSSEQTPAIVTTEATPIQPTTDSATPMEIIATPVNHTSTPESIHVPTTPIESSAQSIPDSTSETMHTAPSSPRVVSEDTDIATFYDPNKIDTSFSSPTTTKKVYAYPKHLIPIFLTPEQEREADSITHSANARSPMYFSINLDKTLEIINFVSNSVDFKKQDQWEKSGKTMFLKFLLEQLKDSNKILVILTFSLDEESLLYVWFRDVLKLRCTRLGNVLTQWDGQYGVMVNTTPSPEDFRFSMVADAILCLDIRAGKYQSVFQQMKSIRKPDTSAPMAYLVALGSVEARSFHYLKENNTHYSERSSDDFKRLFSEENNWPKDANDRSVMGLNQSAAANFSSWLVKLYDTIQVIDYQFRDITELPQSHYYANLKSAQRDGPVVETEDMDVSDDDGEPVTISAVPKTLSPNLTKYIEQIMFPTCEFASPQIQQELPETLRGGNHQTIVKNLVGKYNKDIDQLKSEFEKSVKALQEKYRNEAKEAFLK